MSVAVPSVATTDPRVAFCLQTLAARFTVLGFLGEGGTAYVYQAIDRATGRSVAIKLMHPNLLHEPDARAAFVREAELMESLQHPNIVSVLEVIQLEALGCAIIMPFVDGYTLKQQVKASGAMPFTTIRAILSDLLAALDYAHGVGIAHRDIKPHNIFLDSTARCGLLGDFGIAARLDEQVSPNGPDNMGTPQYMSPEHIDGRAVDRRSDLYSIGCVLYEMITGLEPWGGLSLSEVLQRQRTDNLPDPAALRPDIPADLRHIIGKALAKEPAQRWQSASEMAAALDPAPIPAWARAFSPRASAKPARSASTSPRGPAIYLPIAVGVIMLAVAAVGLLGSKETTLVSNVPMPIGETQVDPSLIGEERSVQEQPVSVKQVKPGPGDVGDVPIINDAGDDRTPPAPPAPAPVAPFVSDDEARSVLGRATQVSGSGGGFELIGSLRALSQSSQVSPNLRDRLRVAAQDLSKQCEGAQLLDPSIRCP